LTKTLFKTNHFKQISKESELMKTILSALMSLLFSFLVVATLFFSMVSANFLWFYELPIEPDKSPPLITVNSPRENQTFGSQNFSLSLIFTKTQTWISPSLGRFVNGSQIYDVLGNLTAFYYTVDGVESQHIPIQDISTIYLADPQQNLSFCVNLTLPEGHHSLYVGVEGETLYRQGGVMDPLLSNRVQGVSEVINFTIAKPPEPFPTTLAITTAAVSATFACTGLLLYFKKHKRKLKRKASAKTVQMSLLCKVLRLGMPRLKRGVAGR
jgi:hypothetical protein